MHMPLPVRIVQGSLLLALLLVAACSSTPVELQPMELERIEATVDVERIWSTKVGKGQDERYTLLVPAVHGDRIYVADLRGQVTALDRHSGKQIWRKKLKEPVSAATGFGGGLVLLGTYDAQVIALDAEDGSERWRQRVSSEVLSPPQSNGSVVVAQSFDGSLSALDHETGRIRWVYEAPMPLLTLRGNATPLIVGSTVYAGFANGKIVALELADGLITWEQRVAIPQGRSELERMVDVDASPLLVGNILFAASYQGELVSMSRATGRPLWSQPVSTFNDLSAGNGNVYVTAADSAVRAYGVSNGVMAWENQQLLRRKLTAPLAVGNYLAVGDEEGGYLHVLSQRDGELVGRRRISRDGLRSPMVAADDLIYVYSNDGRLSALRLRSREQ